MFEPTADSFITGTRFSDNKVKEYYTCNEGNYDPGEPKKNIHLMIQKEGRSKLEVTQGHPDYC